MNRVACVCFVFIAFLGVSAYAEGVDMEVDAEGNPLRKPIIMSHGSSPDHIAAIGKIGKILSREPLSANLKKVSEEDDSVMHSILPVKAEVSPDDIKAHIAKENLMHRNAALARLRAKLAKKLAKKGLLRNAKGKKGATALKKAGLRITKSGKIVRRKSVFDDDDEKVALEKEIRLLEKLIAQGRKIWSALPEKEARLAALRKKIAEMAAGKAKEAAKKKLKALLALLDKVNDKIEALNNKLKQLLKRKSAIQKQIAKYRAIIGGKHTKAKAKPKAPAKGKKAKKAAKKAKKAKKAAKKAKKAKKSVKKAKAKKAVKKAKKATKAKAKAKAKKVVKKAKAKAKKVVKKTATKAKAKAKAKKVVKKAAAKKTAAKGKTTAKKAAAKKTTAKAKKAAAKAKKGKKAAAKGKKPSKKAKGKGKGKAKKTKAKGKKKF